MFLQPDDVLVPVSVWNLKKKKEEITDGIVKLKNEKNVLCRVHALLSLRSTAKSVGVSAYFSNEMVNGAGMTHLWQGCSSGRAAVPHLPPAQNVVSCLAHVSFSEFLPVFGVSVSK